MQTLHRDAQKNDFFLEIVIHNLDRLYYYQITKINGENYMK
jgi:hypothetical protein